MTTQSARQFPSRGSNVKALLGATVGFFIGFGGVSLFGPTAHSFMLAMKLTPTQVGFLVAIPMLTGSLLRIPFGAWVDRNGGKLPFLILLLASLAGIAGLWFMLLTLYPDKLTAQYYPLLLLFGGLGGCGIATFSVGIGQVSYWYPKAQQGKALAIYAGLGNTSPGLVAIVLPMIIAGGGLWFGYLVSVGIVIAGILLYVVLGFNAPYFQMRQHGLSRERAATAAQAHGQELFPAGSMLQTLWDSAAKWRTWALVALYFTSFGGFLGLTAWLPTFWTSFYAAPHWLALALTAGFSLFASLIRVPGGSWADHFGGEGIAAGAYVALLVGALFMTLSASFAWTVVGEVLVAAGMGIANAAVFKLVPQYVPEAVGGAAGWVGGLGALGGFAIPPILGAVAQSFGAVGYARGYAVFVALAVLSLVLTFVLYRGRRNVASVHPTMTAEPAR